MEDTSSPRLTASQFIHSILNAGSIQVSSTTPAVDADHVIVAGRSPRMRAVLVGINYVGTPNQLNGCVNDTIHLQSLLKTGGADIDIHMLNDAGYNGQRQPPAGSHMPTKANILAELEWLVSDAVAGDRLLFHFSGHGTQTIDRSGDEEDGMDEALCPVDFNACGDWEQGLIIDDDIKNYIARLPEGVSMTLVLDACHSGSAADLRYSYPDIATGKMRVSQPHSKTKADIVSISGCRDYQVRFAAIPPTTHCPNAFPFFLPQTSADAFLEPPVFRRLAAQGALSHSIIQTLYDHPDGLSWADFVRIVCDDVAANRFSQRPLLTSGSPLDLNGPCSFYDFLPNLARLS
jgi:hypothetical protein